MACETHWRTGEYKGLCSFVYLLLTTNPRAFSNGSIILQENCLNSDVVEQIYKRNPILRHTHHPLHSPLLPLPYGDINLNCESTGTLARVPC